MQLIEDRPIAMDAQLGHRQMTGHDFPILVAPPQHHRPIEANRLDGTTGGLHEELLRASTPMIEHPQSSKTNARA